MEFTAGEQSEPSERKAATIGRLLGIEAPDHDSTATTPSACARRSSPPCGP